MTFSTASVISGSVIVSVVLSLPTTGPMLLGALKTQDVNLAATFLLFVAVLTVVGMLVSDLLLAALDPRIDAALVSDQGFHRMDPEASYSMTAISVRRGAEPQRRPNPMRAMSPSAGRWRGRRKQAR